MKGGKGIDWVRLACDAGQAKVERQGRRKESDPPVSDFRGGRSDRRGNDQVVLSGLGSDDESAARPSGGFGHGTGCGAALGSGDDHFIGGGFCSPRPPQVRGMIMPGAASWDQITGGSGDDQVTSFSGRDILIGNSGNDKLNGGTDDDLLSGNSGDDLLRGAAGADLLGGRAGRGPALRRPGSRSADRRPGQGSSGWRLGQRHAGPGLAEEIELAVARRPLCTGARWSLPRAAIPWRQPGRQTGSDLALLAVA